MESLQVFIKTEEDADKEDVATQDTKSLEGEPCKESVKSKRSILSYFYYGAQSLHILQMGLKGTVSRDFLLLVFFMNQFPSSFFENSRRYSQVKVHHRYQRHRWQICHRRHILPQVSLVSLILLSLN
jgi:hypothetical protein